MSTYTDFVVNTAALATKVMCPLDDGAGATTAIDYAASPAHGTYKGSPTLTPLADDANNAAITCMQASGGTKYVAIPPTKIFPYISGNWTMNFWINYWHTLGTTVGSYSINGCDTAGGFNNFSSINTMTICLRGDKEGSDTTNKISFAWAGGSAGSRKGVNYAGLSALHYNRQPMMVTIVHTTDNGGTLKFYANGTLGDTTTSADNTTGSAIPLSLNAFCLGSFESNNVAYSTSNFYNNPFNYFNFSFHATGLTTAQIFSMADAYNKNTGLKSENSTVLREVNSKVHTQLVNFVSAGDSNQNKGVDQGYILSDAVALRGIDNNKKLAGYMVGSYGPNFPSVAYLGFNVYTIYQPSANPPTHIIDRNLTRWNDLNGTFSPSGLQYGYQLDSVWVSGLSILNTTLSNLELYPNDPYWQFDPTANMKVIYSYATFTTGYLGSGIMFPSVRHGSNILDGGTGILTKTGTNGWATGLLNIGVIPSASGTYNLSLTKPNTNAQGPIGNSYWHFFDANKTAGIDYADLFAYGGQSAYTMAYTLTDTGIMPLSKLQDFFTEFTRPARLLGQTPYCVLRLSFNQNDINQYAQSIIYSTGTRTFSSGTALSNTREGYTDNNRTIIDRLGDAWVANNYDLNNLKIQFGPYHMWAVAPGNWFQVQQVARAERYMIETVYPTRAYRFDGPNLVTNIQMAASGGYAAGGSDLAHLNITGYPLVGSATALEWANYYVAMISSLALSFATHKLDNLHKLYRLGIR